MKKTQELWNTPHQEFNDLRGISGMREFHGEDLQKESRQDYLKRKQKEWLDQQVKENEEKRRREREEERMYHLQTMEINRMRAELETQHMQKG